MTIVQIHGYAIVSEDDRIADATGATPERLRNAADWRYFQSELDKSDVVVLGRLGHKAHPNSKGRLRLVLSSSSPGLEHRADGWWWNPDRCNWDEAITSLLPAGGRVAVPGGRRVFDLFLRIGYDVFHLSRAEGVKVGPGVSLFSACEQGVSASTILFERGLKADKTTILDPHLPVSLTLWRR